VLRFVAAVLLPWLLFGVAFLPALINRELYRAGIELRLKLFILVWAVLFGMTGLFLGVGLFFIGVWRLIRYRAYRWSLYGWVWLPVMWVNTGLWAFASGH
jgi:hypothetical protein